MWAAVASQALLSSAAEVVAGVEAAGSVAAGAIAERLALGPAGVFGFVDLPVPEVRVSELDVVDGPVRVARVARAVVGVACEALAWTVRVERPVLALVGVLVGILVGVDPVALPVPVCALAAFVVRVERGARPFVERGAVLGRDAALLGAVAAPVSVVGDVARRPALVRFALADPALDVVDVRFEPVARRLLSPVPFELRGDFARRLGVAGGCTGEIDVTALTAADPTSRAAPPIASAASPIACRANAPSRAARLDASAAASAS